MAFAVTTEDGYGYSVLTDGTIEITGYTGILKNVLFTLIVLSLL